MKIVIKATLGALLATWFATSPGICQQAVNRDRQAMFPESIKKAWMLRVGVSAPSPPFVMQAQIGSQDYQGVDPDLARAVAQRAGLKAEFRNFAFSGLLAALQANQVDALWTGLLPSKDRLAVANFAVYFRKSVRHSGRQGESATHFERKRSLRA